MDEKEFWKRLERRVSEEIAGLSGDQWRWWSCDGFAPQRLGLVRDRRAIIGTVLMLNDQGRFSMHFALLLNQEVDNFDQIEWDPLLPSNSVTGWLALDSKKKEMKIDPSAAHSDLSES